MYIWRPQNFRIFLDAVCRESFSHFLAVHSSARPPLTVFVTLGYWANEWELKTGYEVAKKRGKCDFAQEGNFRQP